MGAWGQGLLDNDGAEDVLVSLEEAKAGETSWDVLLRGMQLFDDFLARDGRGETFRAITQAEQEEDNALIRDALSDLPHLLEGLDEDDNASDIPVDTGDHESEMLVAVAALVALKSGIPVPPAKRFAALVTGTLPTDALQQVQQRMDVLFSHERVLQQFRKPWIRKVTALRESIAGAVQTSGSCSDAR